MKFKEYPYFQNEKRILLVSIEDEDDTNEFFLSVSPWKIRISTRNSEDYENDTVYGSVSISEVKNEKIREAFYRHKEFWKSLVFHFDGMYKKIQVEWFFREGSNRVVKYEFFRCDVRKEEYDGLVYEILIGVDEKLWYRYQEMLSGLYSTVDAPRWTSDYEKWKKDYARV